MVPRRSEKGDYSIFCIPFRQGEMVEQSQKGFLVHKVLVCPCRSPGGKRRAAGVPGQGVELKLQVGPWGSVTVGQVLQGGR